MSQATFPLFPLQDYVTDETTEDSNQWYTPDTERQPVISLVEKALDGNIDLDPTSDLQKRVRAKRHITEADNCFSDLASNETIFCNPPFSNPLPFMEWIVEQVQLGQSPQAIMLCKLGVIANQGTGALIKKHCNASCAWSHNGRIRFIPGAGVLARLNREYREGKRAKPTVAGADFDTVLLNFGNGREGGAMIRFCETFYPYGTLWHTVQLSV